MIFCENCGSELEEGTAFCPTCGTKVVKEETNTAQAQPVQSQPQPNVSSTTNNGSKQTSGLGLKIGGAAVAVVAIAAIAFGIANSGTKVDMEANTIIEVTGYDGNGKLSIDVDEESIYWDLEGTKLTEDQIEKLVESIKVEASEDKKLSNGQEITITAKAKGDMDKKLKVKLKNTEWKYTVEDLDEVEVIDPFEYVEVSFSGTAPNGSASFDVKQVPDLGYLDYELDNNKELSNGDKVTLTCKTDETKVNDLGYSFKETSKEYTVEGLTSYIASPADIDEEALSRMQTEATDTINAYLEEHPKQYEVTNTDLQYEGSLVLMKKNYSGWGSNNEVIIIYSTQFSGGEKNLMGETIYFPIRFRNVVKYEDGTIDYDSMEKAYSDNSGVIYHSFWELAGYSDTTSMFSDLARSKTDEYTYEVSDDLKDLFN